MHWSRSLFAHHEKYTSRWSCGLLAFAFSTFLFHSLWALNVRLGARSVRVYRAQKRLVTEWQAVWSRAINSLIDVWPPSSIYRVHFVAFPVTWKSKTALVALYVSRVATTTCASLWTALEWWPLALFTVVRVTCVMELFTSRVLFAGCSQELIEKHDRSTVSLTDLTFRHLAMFYKSQDCG